MGNRFYWLKLKRDFFKRHDIQIIESMSNGKDYVLFYLKLLCESLDHEGSLRFSETIPYNEEMLATITRTNIDTVRSAMKVFVSLGMIELLDDQTIYMREVEKMIGSESESAERMRRHRALSAGVPSHCDADVTKSDTEKEIDKEIELDLQESKKENINNNSSTGAGVREGKALESYNDIMARWELGPLTKTALGQFIQHCALNGKKLTNAKLENIIAKAVDYVL